MAIVLLLTSPVLLAQSAYHLASGKDNNIKVLGKSNVHDWTMTSTTAESQGTFKFNSKNELTDLTTLKFSVLAKSLKSGKSSMDGRTYKSLKADQFATISYQLSSATVTMVQANKYQILTKGVLTIAGKSQPIEMKVSALVNADRSISCHGSKPLLLTDYGIEPPSFMLGAMKVGNALTVEFVLDYIN